MFNEMGKGDKAVSVERLHVMLLLLLLCGLERKKSHPSLTKFCIISNIELSDI